MRVITSKDRINIVFAVLYVLTYINIVIYFLPFLGFLKTLVSVSAACTIFLITFDSVITDFKSYALIYILIFLIFLINFFAIDQSNLFLSVYGLLDVLNVVGLITLSNQLIKERYTFYIYKKLKEFVLIYVCTQPVLAFMQYLQYGANDNVGGSYGLGGSGILSFMSIICCFFLLKTFNQYSSNNNRFTYNYKKLLIIPFGLIPLFINETKISLVLIPVLGFGLVNFKNIRSLLSMGLLSCLVLTAYTQFYSNDVQNSYSISDVLDSNFISEYLLSELDENSGDFVDIPRGTKLFYAYQEFSKDPSLFLFGNDYGAFKGNTSGGKSAFGAQYNWLTVGSRPFIFNLFIMGGIILVVLIFITFNVFIFFSEKQRVENYSNLIFFSILLMILFFYNDALLFPGFLIPFILIIAITKKVNNIKINYEYRKRKLTNIEL